MYKSSKVRLTSRCSATHSAGGARVTFRTLLGALLICACLSGQPSAQSTSGQQPAASQPEGPVQQSPPTSISAPGSAVDTTTFKIGPQDILKVVVWREPDFTGLYTVHSDGKFTLPLVGDIQAGGLTAEQVEKNVSAALAKLIVKPNVTVTVQQVYSQKYYMDGQIGRTGEYPLSAPTTILEAISIAGGLRDFANGKKIYVLRKDKRIPFNYKDVIKGKNLAQNIYLQAGDHVVVP